MEREGIELVAGKKASKKLMEEMQSSPSLKSYLDYWLYCSCSSVKLVYTAAKKSVSIRTGLKFTKTYD